MLVLTLTVSRARLLKQRKPRDASLWMRMRLLNETVSNLTTPARQSHRPTRCMPRQLLCRYFYTLYKMYYNTPQVQTSETRHEVKYQSNFYSRPISELHLLIVIGVDLAGILRGTHGERRRWVGAEWGGVW